MWGYEVFIRDSDNSEWISLGERSPRWCVVAHMGAFRWAPLMIRNTLAQTKAATFCVFLPNRA